MIQLIKVIQREQQEAVAKPCYLTRLQLAEHQLNMDYRKLFETCLKHTLQTIWHLTEVKTMTRRFCSASKRWGRSMDFSKLAIIFVWNNFHRLQYKICEKWHTDQPCPQLLMTQCKEICRAGLHILQVSHHYSLNHHLQVMRSCTIVSLNDILILQSFILCLHTSSKQKMLVFLQVFYPQTAHCTACPLAYYHALGI